MMEGEEKMKYFISVLDFNLIIAIMEYTDQLVELRVFINARPQFLPSILFRFRTDRIIVLICYHLLERTDLSCSRYREGFYLVFV